MPLTIRTIEYKCTRNGNPKPHTWVKNRSW